MQKLVLTNHQLSDLEVPLSKEEWIFIRISVKAYQKKLGYPNNCTEDDQEFFETMNSKLQLLQQLDTDNTQQYKEPQK